MMGDKSGETETGTCKINVKERLTKRMDFKERPVWPGEYLEGAFPPMATMNGYRVVGSIA